ncbi:MAG TPA: hypothetical protein VL651_02530 [Bacteroidia bacterium]|nr:hypothetical protein [Bacteroidia bacterium]
MFFYCSVYTRAQQADSSFFVKNASYISDIIPGAYVGIFKTLSDSFVQNIPVSSKDFHQCAAYYQSVEPGKNSTDTFCRRVQMKWDKQQRLVELKNDHCGSDIGIHYKAFYFTGLKPLYFILASTDKPVGIDTLKFNYGKNGMITSVDHIHSENGKDSLYVEDRLYDSGNKLIVDENAMYGNIRGTFTFEYNANGNVVSRRFMLQSGGAILATDTLIYSVEDSSNNITAVTHKLKVGNGDWMLMDQLMSRGSDGKPVFYSLYFSGAGKSRFQVDKDMSWQIVYDPVTGKRSRESRWNFNSGATQDVIYYYGTGVDSICYESYDRNSNKEVAHRLDKVEVRKYIDGTDLLDTKTITTYSSYFRKKKYTYKVERVETIKYKWSN